MKKLKKGELKAVKMHMFVRRGGQNYKLGLAKLAAVGEELSIPIQVLIVQTLT